ncbi:MAG: HNH endonuclease [Planctomycetota bacterium]
MPAIKGKPVPSRRRREWLTCTTCGKRYWQFAYRAATSKYCSKACWANRAPHRLCEHCGNPIPKYGRRFCSRVCSHAAMQGPKAPRWKDGASLARERATVAPRLAAWRLSVFQRDNHTCQHCFTVGGRLHAHHIKPFAEHPSLRFDLANGVTLCESCHGIHHNRDFGTRRNKTCPHCGTATSGRGVNGCCRSCAIKHLHSLHKTASQAAGLPYRGLRG